jgi:7-cyano-7-deazaguanine synthase
LAHSAVAALTSGGLDSCVCLAHLAHSHDAVYPVYIRCGLTWETAEAVFLRRFLARLGDQRIREVKELSLPMDEVYGEAWYSSGEDIPGYRDPDEAWEIPGRNILLLAKTAVWARLHSVNRISIGILSGNPFPDATLEFFDQMQAALSQGLASPIEILRPLAGMRKSDVIRMGSSLPLELTLSCARPESGLHCGTCGKCRERIEAFVESGIADPTPYASRANLPL